MCNIVQTGLEKNLFGNHPVSLTVESRSPPPAFASDPIIGVSSSPSVAKDGINEGPSKLTVTEITEIDGPGSAGNFIKNSSPVVVRILKLIIESNKIFISFLLCLDKFVIFASKFVLFVMFMLLLILQCKPSLLPQHERLQHMLTGRTLKFHTLRMMKMGIVRSTVGGVSRKFFIVI